MLNLLFVFVFASTGFEGYPNTHNEYDQGVLVRSFYDGRAPFAQTVGNFQQLQSIAETLHIELPGMPVSGYMYRRVQKMLESTYSSVTDLLGRIVAEIEHEKKDRNPDGNPEVFSEEEALLAKYKQLLASLLV